MTKKTIALLVCALALSPALSAGDHRLAYSKKLGVEVLAEEQGGAWCRGRLGLRFVADKAEFFQGPSVQKLVNKLGKLFASQCPDAQQARIRGFVRGSSEPSYQANAARADNWAVVSEPVVGAPSPEVVRAPEPTPSPPPMPAAKLAPQTMSQPIAAGPARLNVGGDLQALVGKWELTANDWFGYLEITSTGGNRFKGSMIFFGNKSGRKAGRGKLNTIEGSMEQMTVTFRRYPQGRKKFSQTYEGVLNVADGLLVGTFKQRSRDKTVYNWHARKVGDHSSLDLPILAYDTFPVGNWTPGETSPHTAPDYPIKTRDKTCVFRYTDLKQPELASLLFLETEGVTCPEGFVHGEGKITIKRIDGKEHKVLAGAFSRGYFTNDRVWDLPIVSRRRSANVENLAGAIVGSDPETRVHYLVVFSEQGGVWSPCHKAQIIAVTENDELFMDTATIQALVPKAINYVALLCPHKEKVKFIGSRVPYFEKPNDAHVLYLTNAKLNWKGRLWAYNFNRADNRVMARHIEKVRREAQARQQTERQAELERQQRERQQALARQQRERQQALERQQKELAARRAAQARARREQAMAADFSRLTDADIYDRLAYLHSTGRPANLATASAAALLGDQPLNVVLLLRVSEVDGNKGEADWPGPVRLSGIAGSVEDEGWYVVMGELDVPKDETNGKGQLLTVLDVDSAIPCEQDKCAEVQDVLSLVRHKHGQNDWTPD